MPFDLSPIVLVNLTSLKKLHLFNNLLTSLPDTLAKCQLLSYINLASNQIQQPPEFLNTSISVKELNLGWNPFNFKKN